MQFASVLDDGGAGRRGRGRAAGVFYAKGDLETDLDFELDRVYKASLAAVQERGYKVTRDERDTLKARVDVTTTAGVDEKGQEVKIGLKRTAEDQTHVSIRVGVFGDEALSRSILQAIQAKL